MPSSLSAVFWHGPFQFFGLRALTFDASPIERACIWLSALSFIFLGQLGLVFGPVMAFFVLKMSFAPERWPVRFRKLYVQDPAENQKLF